MKDLEELIHDDLYERLKLAQRRRAEQPDLSPEEAELLVLEIKKQVDKLDRTINTVLMHKHGFGEAINDSLQLIKVMTSHLRWHIDRAKPAPLEANGSA